MKQPTFFISSTIHDFKDLRSAIKFYLEEQGCKVLASEWNDFQKPLDVHSYEACLTSIRSADYFILLIGARVGGWFDQLKRISITQREYREAYDLHRNGSLKILPFVRTEVWQMREERRELARHLKTTGLDNEIQDGIANHVSRTASDPEFLINFLDEVGRNNETKAAVQGGGVLPTGNWIHVMSGFRDIVDVLQGQLFHSVPVEDMTTRRLLRRELREFLRICLPKMGGRCLSLGYVLNSFRAACPITLAHRDNEWVDVPEKEWDLLSAVSYHQLGARLHPVVLPQVLSMPTFLTFDLTTDSYKETAVYEALVCLNDQIRRYNQNKETKVLEVVFEYSRRSRGENRIRGPVFQIEATKLFTLLHLWDRWVNITILCKSLIRHLDGATFIMPELRSDSPIDGMQTSLDEEKVTNEEIDSFVMTDSPRDTAT